MPERLTVVGGEVQLNDDCSITWVSDGRPGSARSEVGASGLMAGESATHVTAPAVSSVAYHTPTLPCVALAAVAGTFTGVAGGAIRAGIYRAGDEPVQGPGVLLAGGIGFSAGALAAFLGCRAAEPPPVLNVRSNDGNSRSYIVTKGMDTRTKDAQVKSFFDGLQRCRGAGSL